MGSCPCRLAGAALRPCRVLGDFTSPTNPTSSGLGIGTDPESHCWESGAGLGWAACIPWEQPPRALLESGQPQSTLRDCWAKNTCKSLGAQPQDEPTLLCCTPLPLHQPQSQTHGTHSTYVVSREGWLQREAPSPKPGSSQAPHPSGCCLLGSVESNKQWSIPAPMISPAYQDIV